MAKVRRDSERETRVSARKRAESHSTGFERQSMKLPAGVEMFGIKSAKPVRLNILPYKVGKGNPNADEGTLHFERTYHVHRGIGPEQNTYVCPSKTAGKRCPICEFVRANRGDDSAKEFAAKERQLFNVIDLAEPDKGVQIWDISYHLFGKMLDARIRDSEEDDDYEYFADLKYGKTLRVGWFEKSFGGATFYECSSIDFKDRDALDRRMLEEAHCLDDLLIILPYDKLKAIFDQEADDADDDDKPASKDDDEDIDEEEEVEEEEKPKPKAKRPVKKEPEPETDEEEPWAADDEEEEEEEEKPKPKKKSPPKKKVEEESGDDEDWDWGD